MLAPPREPNDILLDDPGEGAIDNDLSSSAPPEEGRGGPAGEGPPQPPAYPLLVVRAGDFRAGVPVARVREVVTLRRLARVPGVEEPFLGILSLRGEVVTVVSLTGLQGAATEGDRPERQDTTGVTTGRIRPGRIDSVVVLRGGHDPLGLEVDGVEEIRDYASRGEGAPAAPETSGSVAPGPGRMWAGIVRDDRGEVGVLDADAVFTMVEALAQAGGEPEALEVGDSGQG